MSPVLIVSVLLYTYDAVFWTIGPLFSEEYGYLHPLNGLFMAGYSVTPLIVDWVVGPISQRFGAKRTMIWSFILGLLALVPFVIFKDSPPFLFVLVLISSAFTTVTAAVNKGVFVDYIARDPDHESEIEALGDMSVNVGYVIGPAVAGVMADSLGNMQAFSVLGVTGVDLTLLLLLGRNPRSF